MTATIETIAATGSRAVGGAADERIAAAQARLHSALARHDGFGHSTATSVTVLGDRMATSTSDGPSTVECDLPPALGGDGTAPTPSTLVRAALGACLAMRYRLLAAERGVELTSLQVTVETDSELRGMLELDASVPAGFTAIRYHVDIESPADRGAVEQLVADGDRRSPVLDMLVRTYDIDHTIDIVAGDSSVTEG